MDNDFKTWVGIIHSFARHNVPGDNIHYRRPRLKAPNDESKENPLQPSPAEKVSPEMAEKLALLEKLGITLDDLEKLFKSR